MKKGDVEIIMSAFLETDYASHWEKNPVYFFMRTIYDKMLFRVHIEKFESVLKDDALHLKSIIKSYLKLYRY